MWPRLVLLVALVAGCAKEGTDLSAWTLATSGTTTAVTLPGSLRDELPGVELDYTLTTRVPLRGDQRGRALGLVVECFHTPVALAVNGTTLEPASGGVQGTWRWVIAPELTSGPELVVVFAVHRDQQAGLGWGVAPRLTDDPRGDPRFRGVERFNHYTAIAALSFLVLMVILYGALYLLDRTRPEYAATVIYGIGFTNVPLLALGAFHVFGSAGPSVAMIVGMLGFAGSLRFIHITFDLGPVPRLWDLTFAVGAAGAVLGALSYRAGIVVGAVYMPLVVAVNAYVFVKLVPLARRGEHRTDARLLLVVAVIALALLLQAMHWVIRGENLFAGLHPMSVQVAVAASVQALILGRQHVARQRKIETTNAELQRQVAERSRELGDALAKLANQPAQPLAIGRIVDGRYRVIEKLGEGGMGSVFTVERISDGRKLALKTIRGRGDKDLLARFAREAQVAAELDHPNLVPVVDVGITDGGLYLVMPLVDGGTLEGQRARFGDRAWAAPLVRQIAAGLAALHARDIIHRDLKPGNVLLAGGVARIADFGLASLAGATPPLTSGDTVDGKGRLAHADTVTAGTGDATQTGLHNRGPASPALTRIGDVFGTPAYMAPELERGVYAVQPPSDVFALGLIAFELYTGGKAFSEPPLVSRMAGKDIPAPDTAGLPDAIARCLAIDPAQRPTAAAVAAELA